MRKAIFIISVVFHLVFLYIAANMKITSKIYRLDQVIEVVPVQPGKIYSPQMPVIPGKRPVPAPDIDPGQVPIIVREFTIPGGTPGSGKGDGAPGKQGDPDDEEPPAVGEAAQETGKDGSNAAITPDGGIDIEPGITPGKWIIPNLDRGFHPALDSQRLREIVSEAQKGESGSSGENFTDIPFRGPGRPGSGDGDGITAYGGSAFFDSRGYDITPWARRVVYRVKKHWVIPPAVQIGASGEVGIFIVIDKDGSVSRAEITHPSGIGVFDQAALTAIQSGLPFPNLPPDFPNANLPAYFVFKYN